MFGVGTWDVVSLMYNYKGLIIWLNSKKNGNCIFFYSVTKVFFVCRSHAFKRVLSLNDMNFFQKQQQQQQQQQQQRQQQQQQ